MNDYSELKNAAEACGPLPWRFIERGITSAGVRDDHGFIAFMDYSHPAKYGACPDREAKARFIGHATPAAVLALISELEVSNNVGRALGETLGSVVESRDALVRVVDQLKAENEALRNEAESNEDSLDAWVTRANKFEEENARHRKYAERYWFLTNQASPADWEYLGHQIPAVIDQEVDALMDKVKEEQDD